MSTLGFQMKNDLSLAQIKLFKFHVNFVPAVVDMLIANDGIWRWFLDLESKSKIKIAFKNILNRHAYRRINQSEFLSTARLGFNFDTLIA